MATEKPELILEFMDVPIQSGLYNCGLFAIAFTTTLALGDKPFDQWNKRAHFRQCILLRRVKKSAVKTSKKVHVYCKCRMDELAIYTWRTAVIEYYYCNITYNYCNSCRCMRWCTTNYLTSCLDFSVPAMALFVSCTHVYSKLLHLQEH